MNRTLSPHLSLVSIGIASLILLGIVYFQTTEMQRLDRENAARIQKEFLTSNAYFDSLRWTKVSTPTPWEARDSAETYEWQGKLFMFGGLDGNGTLVNGQPNYDKAKYFNDIWSTDDGEHWEQRVEHSNVPPLRSVSIVPFGDKLYLYAGWGPKIGFNKDIWESSDGAHWSKTGFQIPFPVREGQQVLPTRGKLYVFGGVDYFDHKVFNDVWESSDGLHWQVLTQAAPWAGRWDYGATDYNGTFWIVGGMTLGGAGFNDVWSSPDGSVWSEMASNTPLGSRQGQVIVQYKGIMWLVGGLDAKSNNGVGDTWYSRNGKDWRKVPIDGGWLGREDHQVVVFKDKLLLFTGMDTNWHWTNDIWVGRFSTDSENIATTTVSPPTLFADSALALYVRKDGTQELFNKNANKPELIASITKLMTATALAEMSTTTAPITIEQDMLSRKGTSGIFPTSSQWSADTLLHLMLVESNNDAASVLASSRGEAFVVSNMNALAEKLGMNNTVFVNPVGFDEDLTSNTSSAKDLATLLQYIYKNHPEILTITTEMQFEAADTTGQYNHTATSTDLLLSDATFPFTIVGGKTGSTPQAMQNLVLLVGSPRSSDYLIFVVLDSENNFDDMRKLANYVESSFSW